MSSNGLMETSPGGENTQYESIKTVTSKPEKDNGQLSEPPQMNTKTAPGGERGAQTAENMRYGQAMSEQGVGGFTNPEQNDGRVGGGSKEDVGVVAQSRKEQGYDAGREMDRNIGG